MRRVPTAIAADRHSDDMVASNDQHARPRGYYVWRRTHVECCTWNTMAEERLASAILEVQRRTWGMADSRLGSATRLDPCIV